MMTSVSKGLSTLRAYRFCEKELVGTFFGFGWETYGCTITLLCASPVHQGQTGNSSRVFVLIRASLEIDACSKFGSLKSKCGPRPSRRDVPRKFALESSVTDLSSQHDEAKDSGRVVAQEKARKCRFQPIL
jgi:hypothetical protein